MLLKTIVLFCMCASLSYGTRVNTYTGQPLSEEEISTYTERVLDNCTADIQPCDPNERKRVDGSCNNLKYPGRGVFLAPQRRLLDPYFHNGIHARKAKSGEDLPLERIVRTTLLKEGKSIHSKLNHNVPGFLIFMFNDNGSPHDIENMILEDTFCCEEAYMNDDRCTPNIIPEDDPVHRFSGIRCMNSTRPITHQSLSCTNDPTPSPIQKATPVCDLSQIYNGKGKGDSVIRSFKNGELIVEQEEGRDYPPNGPTAYCPNNKENETRCFENHANTLLPIALFTIWIVRHHNYVARELAILNPCWDDETLFHTARDIQIAYVYQMFLYEVLVALQGEENLIKANIIVKDGGFRDVYDDTKYPIMSMEYGITLRWFHMLQESTAKLSDKNRKFVEDIPLFDLTFRTGYMPKGRNMEYLTQSTFSPCHGADWSIDYDMANRALPGVQESVDAPTGDMNKNRHNGLAPYTEYVYLFYGRNITSFEDLEFLIDPERIELLKTAYKDVWDIDLTAGLWLEKIMEGGEMTLTHAHIMNEQMLWSITSDRHWYESSVRPYAFTEAQLKEIRKSTLSLMLCNVGDDIMKVPKNSFLKISDENPLVCCSEVPRIDFSAWADEKCNKM